MNNENIEANKDVAVIRQLIRSAERHQNDVEPFLALHTDDVVIVNIAGRRIAGKEAFSIAMRRALDSSLDKVITTVAIENINFINPDVAIVSCTKRVLDQRDPATDGLTASLPSMGMLSYVVVRSQDGWKITLAQTTPVMAR